jgi:hypothetical protein
MKGQAGAGQTKERAYVQKPLEKAQRTMRNWAWPESIIYRVEAMGNSDR